MDSFSIAYHGRNDSIAQIASFIAMFLMILAGVSLAEPTATVTPTSPSPLAPGTRIDASNVATYSRFLPAAAELAVRHGFSIRVVPTKRLDWSTGFTQATEKYSPQVSLDSEDNITNYIAGAPFPTVTLSDPKAAVKIAYNWHMGPFMPDDFSLTPWGSFAYSDVAPNTIQAEEDYNYICEQFTFMRFAHRTEVDPRPTIGSNSLGFEWKARCNLWTATPEGDGGEGSGIWIRFLDPHRGDEFYGFDSQTRRVRRMGSGFVPVNEACRSCHQPYWAYALPKTEEYSYRVLGTASLLACLTANDEPAGLVPGDIAMKMGEEPFELRNAYILEMTPKTQTYGDLRTLVYVDTEAYLWIGAEFFAGNERTGSAIPLWRSHPSTEGGNLFDLAGEFYVPDRQPPISPKAERASIASAKDHQARPEYPRWFFRALIPAHGTFEQKIDTGDVSEGSFNPQTLSR